MADTTTQREDQAVNGTAAGHQPRPSAGKGPAGFRPRKRGVWERWSMRREARRRRQTPSLDELIVSFWTPERPCYEKDRTAYQLEHGQIRDSYFAKHIHAAALIVKPPGVLAHVTQKRKINLRYDGLRAAAVQPEFEAAIWRARALERESGLILGGRSRKVLVEMLYTILVYLLSVLDAVSECQGSKDEQADRRRRVESALKSVNKELDRLDTFMRAASEQTSLRWYLLGLPAGALVGFGMISAADRWSTLVGAPSQLVRVCFACGAVGAIVSVMTRITRGQRLVDSQQGHFVTLLAGGFRPLIGAVFGLALYVFVQGGLVPIATPDDDTKGIMFFAALAFLSGFSERWAQDTIVQSAPMPAGQPASQREDEGRGQGTTASSSGSSGGPSGRPSRGSARGSRRRAA